MNPKLKAIWHIIFSDGIYLVWTNKSRIRRIVSSFPESALISINKDCEEIITEQQEKANMEFIKQVL